MTRGTTRTPLLTLKQDRLVAAEESMSLEQAEIIESRGEPPPQYLERAEDC